MYLPLEWLIILFARRWQLFKFVINFCKRYLRRRKKYGQQFYAAIFGSGISNDRILKPFHFLPTFFFQTECRFAFTTSWRSIRPTCRSWTVTSATVPSERTTPPTWPTSATATSGSPWTRARPTRSELCRTRAWLSGSEASGRWAWPRALSLSLRSVTEEQRAIETQFFVKKVKSLSVGQVVTRVGSWLRDLEFHSSYFQTFLFDPAALFLSYIAHSKRW